MKKILPILFLFVFSFSAIHAEMTWKLSDDGTPEEKELSLTDNKAYTQQSQIDGVDVYYTRDFSTNWEAIYLPFSLKYEDWKDDFEVARINAVHQYDTNDDGDIDKTELEFVKMTILLFILILLISLRQRLQARRRYTQKM